MMGFAQGIDICYGSTKDDLNVVFFQDGSRCDYRIGGILEEIVRDDVVEMLTEGLKKRIRRILDRADGEVTSDWYVRLFEELDLASAPVAGALFRSGFYEAYLRASIRKKDENESAFIEECYDYFVDQYATAIVMVAAMAAKNSGYGDDHTDRLVSMMDEWVDGYSVQFFGSDDTSGVGVPIPAQRVVSWLPLLLHEYGIIRKYKKNIRFCENCGRIFIPQKRSDAKYCDYPSPQDLARSCKDIGAQLRRKRKRENDTGEREHHNTICRLHNMVRRAQARGDNLDLIAYYRRQIDAEMLRYETIKAKKHNQQGGST